MQSLFTPETQIHFLLRNFHTFLSSYIQMKIQLTRTCWITRYFFLILFILLAIDLMLISQCRSSWNQHWHLPFLLRKKVMQFLRPFQTVKGCAQPTLVTLWNLLRLIHMELVCIIKMVYQDDMGEISNKRKMKWPNIISLLWCSWTLIVNTLLMTRWLTRYLQAQYQCLWELIK